MPAQGRMLTSMPMPDGDPHVCDRRPLSAHAIKSETIVFFTVETDGTVQNVKVEKSSGDAALDEYAASCVAKWAFVPAFKGLQGVAVEWFARLKW
jgi:TonB family protein